MYHGHRLREGAFPEGSGGPGNPAVETVLDDHERPSTDSVSYLHLPDAGTKGALATVAQIDMITKAN